MSSPCEISASELLDVVGLPDAPRILDVRSDADFAADPRLLPGALRRDAGTVESWANAYAGARLVVSCRGGHARSHGVAAWLRHEGAEARALEGGFDAWRAAGGPLVASARLPRRDAKDRTVWVTRARPKLDRVACPWLVRRFVDPSAVFLFVPAAEVASVAERFRATPFDVDGVFWSHRGDRCTFDTMLDEFGLDTPALRQLALVVRGADTATLGLAPEAAGLLAVAVGFSHMHGDDLAQVEAALPVYDALYRRCRDASHETHHWPSPVPAVV